MEQIKESLSLSELYRLRRPEYFSDSIIKYDMELPQEVFDFKLSEISKNQQQDEFETFCRRLAEKFITPNLIPQVGPTGGGDGKTDSETYPVSTAISERWFIPENRWEHNEKWAFAISAKQDWRSKIKKDVESIVNTARGYTHIYFMTNQKPSSKQKKEVQDDLFKKFNVEIIIIDRKWIIEKIYNNNLIELAVDTLGISNVYKNKRIELGPNDSLRLKQLDELEHNIHNPNRYFEYDFQLVEDAIQAAIFSRMLEKSKDEVLGKFDRAFRFCSKLNNERQWIRFYYQRAWTYIHWYDDYDNFVNDFIEFKKIISSNSNINNIELYFNLCNLLKGLFASEKYDFTTAKIDVDKEEADLLSLLDTVILQKEKPCSSLIAKTYKLISVLSSVQKKEMTIESIFQELSAIMEESNLYLDYPFDSIVEIIKIFGKLFPDNEAYDKLIDKIASISEKKNSELASGNIFLYRGLEKFEAKLYKDSIVYWGKSFIKLGRNEAKEGMYLALNGLGLGYRGLGLMWASNLCFISAASITFKSWYEKGVITNRMFSVVSELAENELFIGRFPSILTWNELLLLISTQVQLNEDQNGLLEFLDACLAVRLINTDNDNDTCMTKLPDLLEEQKLWLSQNAVLYKLGYSDLILNDYKSVGIDSESELDCFFKKVSDQPFVKQMIFETNFMSGEQNQILSIILGCSFKIQFREESLLIAEMLLTFLESFFATSSAKIFPIVEEIVINIYNDLNVSKVTFKETASSTIYEMKVNAVTFFSEDKKDIQEAFFTLLDMLFSKNFIIENSQIHLEHLIKEEGVLERISLIWEYDKFYTSVLGDGAKQYMQNWLREGKYKEYDLKSFKSLKCEVRNEIASQNERAIWDLENSKHNERKVCSIIDDSLWNKARWNGFGSFIANNKFYIAISFHDVNVATQIFDDWIKEFGQDDKEDSIRISIIKGVNKEHPYWYRVHICKNIQKQKELNGKHFITTSRFHEMNANNPINLNFLIQNYSICKEFILCPAMTMEQTLQMLPDFSKGIIKHELIIRNAWEIGVNDVDSVVIKLDDNLIIPDNINNPPVIELLEKKRIK